MQITEGKKITLEYSLHLSNGTEIEAKEGDNALTVTIGNSEIFPALEQAMIGLTEGDSKVVKLSASESYGPIDDENFQTIDIDLIPSHLQYRGAKLTLMDESGQKFETRISRFSTHGAIVDFNHPLAGKALIYNIKITNVEDARKIH